MKVLDMRLESYRMQFWRCEGRAMRLYIRGPIEWNQYSAAQNTAWARSISGRSPQPYSTKCVLL